MKMKRDRHEALPDFWLCENFYHEHQESDRPKVLLAMAVGLRGCHQHVDMLLKGCNKQITPSRRQLLDEANRRYHLQGLKKTNFHAYRPGAAWNVEQTMRWLRDNPIQGEQCVSFVLETLESTNFGLGPSMFTSVRAPKAAASAAAVASSHESPPSASRECKEERNNVAEILLSFSRQPSHNHCGYAPDVVDHDRTSSTIEKSTTSPRKTDEERVKTQGSYNDYGYGPKRRNE